MTATESWASALDAWTIPPAILDAAPENPYAFPAGVLRDASVDPRRTPTGAAIARRLGPGEALLDVGCGAGRIAGPLAEDYRVTGVEPRPQLRAEAAARGVTTIDGTWPDAAEMAGPHPVVLSTHVAYDVREIGPFVAALDAAALRRVVIEVTAAHPWVWIGPLYERLHDLPRPQGPRAADLRRVIAEVVGVAPRHAGWRRPGATYDSVDAMVDHTRRMLCLAAAPDTDAIIRRWLLAEATPLSDGRIRTLDSRVETMWWDTDG